MSKPVEDSRVATLSNLVVVRFLVWHQNLWKQKLSVEPKLDDKNKLTADFCGVLVGSKMLRKAPVDKGDAGINKTMCVFGIFREPLAFLTIAKEVQHPFDSFRAVPQKILKVVCNTVEAPSCGPWNQRLSNYQNKSCKQYAFSFNSLPLAWQGLTQRCRPHNLDQNPHYPFLQCWSARNGRTPAQKRDKSPGRNEQQPFQHWHWWPGCQDVYRPEFRHKDIGPPKAPFSTHVHNTERTTQCASQLATNPGKQKHWKKCVRPTLL